MVRTIHCSGSHYEIGLAYGSAAKDLIAKSVENYTEHFKATCALSLNQLQIPARRVEATLKRKVPHLYEEIQGIAQGSGYRVDEIVLLNARSEIVLTAGSAHATLGTLGGCSTYGQIYNGQVWAAQNWDWNSNQREQLVHLILEPHGKPKCHILTEAGLIGKVGLNSYGVVTNLNAIKASNMDLDKLPLHVLLRVPMEHKDCASAVKEVQLLGAASVGHVMISDAVGNTSFETNPDGPWAVNKADKHGRVFHTNHAIVPDRSPTMKDEIIVQDTFSRLNRLKDLAQQHLRTTVNDKETSGDGCGKSSPSYDSILALLKDEQGSPFGICRVGNQDLPQETIFSIVANCSEKKAKVTIGLPCDVRECVELSF